MDQQELCFLTINDAGHLIRRLDLSPVELTRAFLSRIEANDGDLHAVLNLMAGEALADARVAESEILQGRYRGPLHGIPVAVKDQFDAAGAPAVARKKSPGAQGDRGDATALRKLKEAGAVFLGKLATSAVRAHEQQARNPWNLAHITGGSSSGPAAAAAAGLCMGALGEDTAGSIRKPASYCGLVGLKPTYGRVSRHGLAPISWSLDHAGPMTWTVEDAALMLGAIAGYDPKDSTTSRAPVPNYAAALTGESKGLVVGVPRAFIQDSEHGLDPEVLATVDKAFATMESLGMRVEELEIPSLGYGTVATTVIEYSEIYAGRKREFLKGGDPSAEAGLLRLCLGALTGSADYVQAQRVRSQIKTELAEVFRRVDVIATPTQPTAAPTFEDYDPMASLYVQHYQNFLAPFNLTGLPAVSVPCGFSKTGMPIGLQLVGKPFDEATVLRVGHAYEQHAGWFHRRPPV